MAAQMDTAAINGVLTKLFKDEVERTVNRTSLFAQLIRVERGGGTGIYWTAEFTGAAAGATADGADITTFASDDKAPATLPWGFYTSGIKQTGLALAQAASSISPAQLRDLFGRDVRNAADQMAQQLNLDCYTQASSAGGVLPLTALDSGVASTGVYAGIDRSAKPLWASVVNKNGGTGRPVSLALMRAVRRAQRVAGGKLGFIVTDPIQYDNYGALMDNQRRYLDSVRTAKGEIKLDAGFQALEFEGVPLFWDKDCPPGTMYFFDDRDVFFEYLPDATVPGFDSIFQTVAQGSADKPASIPVTVNALARTGDSNKAFLKTYLQLVVKNPRHQAVLGDLS